MTPGRGPVPGPGAASITATEEAEAFERAARACYVPGAAEEHGRLGTDESW